MPTGEIQFLARGMSPPLVLVHTEISANLSDDVRRSFSLPVGGEGAICVVASASPKKLTCPPEGDPPGWAIFRVPGFHEPKQPAKPK